MLLDVQQHTISDCFSDIPEPERISSPSQFQFLGRKLHCSATSLEWLVVSPDLAKKHQVDFQIES